MIDGRGEGNQVSPQITASGIEGGVERFRSRKDSPWVYEWQKNVIVNYIDLRVPSS